MTKDLCGWILGVVVAFVLAGAVEAGAQEEIGLRLPDNPLQGRLLFESRHCNQCHGMGASHSGIGPSLGEGHFSGTFLDLGAALWNHVPGMSVTIEVTGLGWPELSSEEVTELVVFLNFVDYLGRPGVAESGQGVFEAGGCGQCHFLGGGKGELGPDLAELQKFASPLFVAQEIWNHGPSMFETMQALDMKPPQFGEGELADLSAYIRQQAESGPRERLLLAPGNPNAGREVFTAKGCSICHGRDARGGAGGPNLSEMDLHRSAEAIAGIMWNHALAMSATMRARGISWPEFRDSELADLVAFLYFLPFADPPGDPVHGAEVFQQQSCAECHAGSTGDPGADMGPELAGAEAVLSSAGLVAAMWNHAPVMKRAILTEGRPWPELTGEELRDLHSYLRQVR